MIQFADPSLLWMLNGLPLFTAWYIWQHKRQQAALQLSSISFLVGAERSAKIWLRHSLFVLRMISCAALIIALARPQVTLSRQTIASEGMDIVLAIDVSGSMLAKDFVPNRLEAAKKVATDFISKRPNDRIGVVFFAAEAYTGCPITIDHHALTQVVENVKIGSLKDGTAIGMGLGTAANRLKESRSTSKMIILVTDGENNAGTIKPIDAAQLAKALNIRTYCIGILAASAEGQPVSRQDSAYAALGGPTAEVTLMQIAEITGGKYFRAANEKKLAGIYKEIDAMEKTKVNVTSYKRYEEHFYLFALIAAAALLVELILRNTIFKTAP